MDNNDLTATNGYLNNNNYNNYYASGTGLGLGPISNKNPFIKYNKTNNNIVFVNGEKEYEVPTLDSQDSIVDKVISRLMEEGMANILFDSIISKLSEYLDSEDNKELIEDLLNNKINLVKENLDKELTGIRAEIDQIRLNIEGIKVALGLNGNYNSSYYLGDISTRLNKLETTSNKVEGLWNNYLGEITSLINKDKNSTNEG